MIASVDVTIGSHIFSHIERIAQFRLVNDVDPPALSCYDRYHVRIFFVYLALPGSSSYASAAFSKWNKSSIILYDLGVAFVALKQGVEEDGDVLDDLPACNQVHEGGHHREEGGFFDVGKIRIRPFMTAIRHGCRSGAEAGTEQRSEPLIPSTF